MNDFWNQRFGGDEYAYGTQPNEFYKEQLEKLEPGKILFPAEGEGRNAVYAATQGWDVAAFDPSTEGKRKAELLALSKNVSIEYLTSDYENIHFPEETFDCVVLIFAHMHPLKRNEYHKKLVSYLKPGGTLILEGFAKKQIFNKTGGPQNIDMLFSKEELENDFSGFSNLEITETEVNLDEGAFHRGTAAVIRVLGKK